MENRSSSGNAILILILGILGIVCCAPAPVAWILGNNALKDLQAGLGNPNDRGLIEAGRILGIIGTVLLIIAALLPCLYFAFNLAFIIFAVDIFSRGF